MEGIRKKLEFNGKLLQIQAVHALHKLVSSKLSKSSAHGFQSTQHVAELNFLLELCCHGNQAISTTARQCMLGLIERKTVDLQGCIKQLLLLLSSTHLPSLLTFLSEDLIKRDIAAAAGERCSRKASEHPLAVVYKSLPSQYQLISISFTNSLPFHQIKNPGEKDRRIWEKTLEYHREFFQSLISDGAGNSLLYCMVTTCLSATAFLDYTVQFLLDLLTQSQDIHSASNLSLLEAIWLNCIHSLTSLSTNSQYLLNFYSLAAITRGEMVGRRLWRLLTDGLINGAAAAVQHGLLCLIVKNNLNGSIETLTDILYLVRSSIESQRSLSCAILAMPLLELLSALNLCHPTNSSLLAEAEKCLRLIDNELKSDNGDLESSKEVHFPFLTQLGEPELLTASDLHGTLCDPERALTYLQSVESQAKVGGDVSQLSVYTVVAVLVTAGNTNIQLAALNTVRVVSDHHPTQTSGLFLVVIHWMKRSLHPDILMAALDLLPSFSQHKFNLAAVLKYLSGLAASARTRALSLRLLCDVASVQSKAFPFLVQFVQKYSNDSSPQAMVAKVKAILHVCNLRPSLHTTEILPILNTVLSSAHTQLDTVISLALQCLSALVEAEVLDIKSTWSVITGHLQQHLTERPLIVATMCEFLSLASDLQDTEVYAEFKDMVLRLLWSYTQSASPPVSSAAYKALAKFPYDNIKYSYLPLQLCELYSPSDYSDNQSKYDSEPVNGAALVDLLESVPDAALQGYQTFMQSLVIAETDRMGVGQSRSLVSTRLVNVPRTVLKIPDHILTAYNDVKVDKPGTLLSNLTVGMMFCQSAVQLKDKATNSEARLALAASKRVLDQLFKFIRQGSALSLAHDWMFTKQLLVAWETYISHVLTSVVMGRRADAQLSRQGSVPSDLELIVRSKDQVEGVISTAAKYDAQSQCNAIMALSSLVTCTRAMLAQYHIQEDKLPTAYVKSESNVLDGLISVAECQLNRAKFPWFTAVGQALTFNTGVVCLRTIPYEVYKANPGSLLSVYKLLRDLITKELADNESEDIFYLAQTAGSITASLLNHRHQDVADEQTVSMMDWCVRLLYEQCIAGSINEGCVLGWLELAFALLNGDSDQVNLVPQTHNWYKTRASTSIHRYARAVLASLLYADNKLEDSVEEEVKAILQRPMTRESACGAAILLSTLSQHYHPLAGQWCEELERSMLELRKSLGEEKRRHNTGTYFRAMFYLTGLPHIQENGGELSSLSLGISGRLAESLQTVEDNSQSYSWLSGSLYRLTSALSTSTQGRVNPQTYKHSLPPTSVLRHLIERLHSHTKGRLTTSPDQLLVLVHCVLSGAVRKQLPPLYWSSLFTPLMRVAGDAGDEIEASCLKIAMSQSKGCTLSAAFLSKWCTPRYYSLLSRQSRASLCDWLDKYIDCVGGERLREVRGQIWLVLLRQDTEESGEMLAKLLKSLKTIGAQSINFAPSTATFVYETLCLICHNLQLNNSLYLLVVDGLSECLLHCEQSLTNQLLTEPTDYVTRLHLISRLISTKSTPASLVSLVDLLAPQCERSWLLRTLQRCWNSLSEPQAMDLFVKMQEAISKSTDLQYVCVWLDVLATAVLTWTKGRVQYARLSTVFPYYIHKLTSEKPWNQLQKQTSEWVNNLHLNPNTSDWLDANS